MKEVVRYVTSCHGYSESRACALTRQHRATQRKPSRRDPRTALRLRMREITQTRIRYGYRRVLTMLRREGWAIGKKLVYRLYCEEGLVYAASVRSGAKWWCVGRLVVGRGVLTRLGAWILCMTSCVTARNSGP